MSAPYRGVTKANRRGVPLAVTLSPSVATARSVANVPERTAGPPAHQARLALARTVPRVVVSSASRTAEAGTGSDADQLEGRVV